MFIIENAINGFLDEIQNNFGLYIGLLFLYTISAAAGAFTVAALPEDLINETVLYVGQACEIIKYQRPNIFIILFRGLMGNLVCFFLISLSSVKKFLVPAGVLVIAFSGMACGFASRVLIFGLGTRGIVLSLLCVWLCELLILPSRCKGIQLAYVHSYSNEPKTVRLAFALCIGISSIAVLWQCVIMPFVMLRFI